jgi:hypothetical protein
VSPNATAFPGASGRPRLAARALRRRSLSNLLRMGHCAPTVMKTLLDAHGVTAPWLIKLVAGFPGGIGNSGNECGGMTAPLVFLGLRHAGARSADGTPVAVSRGRALVLDFEACHGTTSCRDILGRARLPLRCAGVVALAPERCVEMDGSDCTERVPAEWRAAAALLSGHLTARGFHCAHAVLRQVRRPEPVEPALFAATSAFVGGTACCGMTCSALAAGVMLLGLAFGELEDSRRRVLKMIGTMAVRGDAFADDLNGFNRAMNRGHELATWFAAEHGSTRCSTLTGCDLSTLAGVRRFVEADGVDRCQDVARSVAARVRDMAGRTGIARTPEAPDAPTALA